MKSKFVQTVHIVEPYVFIVKNHWTEESISSRNYYKSKACESISVGRFNYYIFIDDRKIKENNEMFEYVNISDLLVGDYVELPHGKYKIKEKVIIPNNEILYKIKGTVRKSNDYESVYNSCLEEIKKEKQKLIEIKNNKFSFIEFFRSMVNFK